MTSGAPDSSAEEEAEIEKAIQAEMRKEPLSAAGYFWRGMFIALGLAVLMCGGGYYGIQTWIATYAAQRDAVIRDLRAQGEPLTAAELTRFTAVPEGTDDLTERYQGILRKSADNKILPSEMNLPIVSASSAVTVPAPGVPWPDEARAEKYLANRPWLKEVEDLADVPGKVSIQREHAQGTALLLPEIQSLRALARDLTLQFRVQMRKGDRAAALRSLRALFGLSRVLEREPLLVSQLARTAMHGVAIADATDFLRDGKATRDEIANLRQVLDNDFRESLVRGLKGERACGLITLTSSDLAELKGLVGELGAMSYLTSKSKVADLRPGDTAKLLETLTEAIEIAEANEFPEMTKQFELQAQNLQKMEADQKYALPWNRNVLLGTMLPAIGNCGTAFARATAHQSALKAALDVEEKLLALPPAERTKEAEIAAIQEFLPIDPFTGEPMKYVVGEKDYRIYSVGSDGADDGGPDGKHQKDAGVRIERTLPK